MVFKVEPAKLEQTKARVALVGVAGCGKTYTALITAQELGKKVVVLDTENKSSAKYAQTWPSFGFDVLPMPDYAIKTYIDALDFVSTKYDVVIVDSLSHAWAGRGGALEMAETMKAKHGGNKFAAWGDVTPLQNQLVEIILNYPQHIIATMRMKMEYVLTQDDRGKTSPQKVGLGIVQRDSFEYEFDIVGQMDIDHNLLITKTRCPNLDGFMMHKPDGTFGKVLSAWLNNGDPVNAPRSFSNLEALLFGLYEDFKLSEAEARTKLKELGFTGFPTENGEARKKSAEMYRAVKLSINSMKLVKQPTLAGVETAAEAKAAYSED